VKQADQQRQIEVKEAKNHTTKARDRKMPTIRVNTDWRRSLKRMQTVEFPERRWSIYCSGAS